MTNAELKQIAVELVGEQELARRFRLWITGMIKKEQQKRQNMGADELFLHQAGMILDDLNKRAKRRHTLNDTTLAFIRRRMSEGYTPEDFYRVHEIKCAKWLYDEVMDQCLRPSTLYRPGNFADYLAEWDAMDQKRQESEQKRQAAINTRERQNVVKTVAVPQPLSAEIAKLLATPWYSFKTWAEFYLHSLKLPSAEALEAYEMPDRIRRMRLAPGMMQKVIMKRYEEYRWAEEEYQQIKRAYDSKSKV